MKEVKGGLGLEGVKGRRGGGGYFRGSFRGLLDFTFKFFNALHFASSSIR